MRTSNPALNDKTFQQVGRMMRETVVPEQVMTIDGTVNRTGILLFLCLMSAGYTWKSFFAGNAASVQTLMWAGIIGGLVVAVITVFKKTAAPVTAPLYALLEGLALGGISAMFEMRFPGIVIQAVGLTFGTLFCLLLAYKSGLIRVTENLKLGVIAATGAVCVLYMVDLGMAMFGTRVPFIHESGIIGIGFSLFVVALASFNLVLDFDFIERGAENGAPKYMEWYAAFGLLVTLIWLYLEILKLLAKSRSRR